MHIPALLVFFFALLANSSCNENAGVPERPPVKKPASGLTDTLFVEKASIIFYMPDSTQLERIRAVTDSSMFGSMMHEYEYMLKNALHFISNAPETRDIPVTEARFKRFILFRMDTGDTCIDLDQRGDAIGMFFFHPSRKPVPVDMANISLELPVYFRESGGD